MSKQKRPKRNPRGARAKKGENVFLFDKSLETCLGEVEGAAWDGFIVTTKGDVIQAAALAEIAGVRKGAKALWGKTREEALQYYRDWQAKQSARAAE